MKRTLRLLHADGHDKYIDEWVVDAKGGVKWIEEQMDKGLYYAYEWTCDRCNRSEKFCECKGDKVNQCRYYKYTDHERNGCITYETDDLDLFIKHLKEQKESDKTLIELIHPIEVELRTNIGEYNIEEFLAMYDNKEKS